MNSSFTTFGVRTPLITEGDDLAGILIESAKRSDAGGFLENDILILAETALAIAEGNIIRLDSVAPDEESGILALRYRMDPRLVEVIRRESDAIVGGIPGFLLCMKHGTLLPNAGIDASNAPEGCVVPLPSDPDGSALVLKKEVFKRCNVRIGVIIVDSRTHAMRVGCGGVAIGCAGIPSVLDARGRSDLYGRKLEVTRQALADNLASAAEIVMGEADECTPAAIIRGLGIPVGNQQGIEVIDAKDCLFMGLLSEEKE